MNVSSSTIDADLEPAADEFLITRTFFAPPNMVYEAWIDRRLLAEWWGPESFTNPSCEMDVRPGGSYRVTMRSPGGVDYPLTGVYREVAESECLVMTVDTSAHPPEWQELVNAQGGTGSANAAGEMVQMVTFDALEGNRTQLAIHTRFESPAIRDAMLGIGITEGWAQSLDRLAALLATGREIVTTRLIDHPPATVFRAFSDPACLSQWWGPAGFSNTFQEFDFRPGGHWRFVMHGPDGADYPNHSILLEITEPRRIVFRHLGPEHHFQMTILLADRDGKTTLTWRMLSETVEHCDATKSFIVAATEQNFDRLENELAKL